MGFSQPQPASDTCHFCSHTIAKASCMTPFICKGARNYRRESEPHRPMVIGHVVEITEIYLVTTYFPLVIRLREWQSLRRPSRVVLSTIMVLILALDFHMQKKLFLNLCSPPY